MHYYLMSSIENIDTNNFTIIENDIRSSFLKQILESENLEFNHLIFNELD